MRWYIILGAIAGLFVVVAGHALMVSWLLARPLRHLRSDMSALLISMGQFRSDFKKFFGPIE